MSYAKIVFKNRSFVPIFSLLYLVICLSCSTTNTTRKITSFYGNVKSVKEDVYLADDVSGTPTPTMLVDTKIMEYDKNGRHLNTKHYRPDEKGSAYIWVYRYDENGVKTQVDGHFYNENSEINMKFTYQYDKKGRETEQLAFDKDGKIMSKLTYTYDRKGNKIKMRQVNHKGELLSTLQLKYDEHGNITEEISYKPDGKEWYVDIFTYQFDVKNNWIKQIQSRNGQLQISEREIKYY